MTVKNAKFLVTFIILNFKILTPEFLSIFTDRNNISIG